jgi:hypothetical protein
MPTASSSSPTSRNPSYFQEPVYAFRGQITSGGHRIAAMRAQGLRWGLGLCDESALGVTVPMEQARLPNGWNPVNH